MREVFKSEDGTYRTIPDGDKATIEEIIKFELLKKSNEEQRTSKRN